MILAICNDTHETRAIQRRWNVILYAYMRKGYTEKQAMEAMTKRAAHVQRETSEATI